MTGRERRRGFTLVELLVVITIIGILISLLLPALGADDYDMHSWTCYDPSNAGFSDDYQPRQDRNGLSKFWTFQYLGNRRDRQAIDASQL